MYREGAVTDQMCQKWFAKFHAGDFLLDDAPWPGGPVAVDSNQIETLRTINAIPHMTADKLKICKSIKLLMRMKTMPFVLQKKCNVLFGQPRISEEWLSQRVL